VRGAPLNLRAGAGTQFKILTTVRVGEEVSVLERKERWIHVRKSDGREGWIAAGYLDATAPPRMRVDQLDEELGGARAELEQVSGELEALRAENASLTKREASRSEEFARIERENMQLRAGARWPEWITGALIFATGMALGAVLRRRRQQQSRIRL
jgi:SH3 domain protein